MNIRKNSPLRVINRDVYVKNHENKGKLER